MSFRTMANAMARMDVAPPLAIRDWMRRLERDEDFRELWDEVLNIEFEPKDYGRPLPMGPGHLYLAQPSVPSYDHCLFVHPPSDPAVGFIRFDHGFEWLHESASGYIAQQLEDALERRREDSFYDESDVQKVHDLAEELEVEPEASRSQPPPAFVRIHERLDFDQVPDADDDPRAFEYRLAAARDHLDESPVEIEREVVELFVANPSHPDVLELLLEVYDRLDWPLHARNVGIWIDDVIAEGERREERYREMIEERRRALLGRAPEEIDGVSLTLFDERCRGVLEGARRDALTSGVETLQPEDVIDVMMQLEFVEGVEPPESSPDDLEGRIYERRRTRSKSEPSRTLEVGGRLVRCLEQLDREATERHQVDVAALYRALAVASAEDR